MITVTVSMSEEQAKEIIQKLERGESAKMRIPAGVGDRDYVQSQINDMRRQIEKTTQT